MLNEDMPAPGTRVHVEFDGTVEEPKVRLDRWLHVLDDAGMRHKIWVHVMPVNQVLTVQVDPVPGGLYRDEEDTVWFCRRSWTADRMLFLDGTGRANRRLEDLGRLTEVYRP